MPAPSPVSEDLVGDLIEEVAPLNNHYRQAMRDRRPVYLCLGYLWDIGDILVEAGVEKATPVARAIHERSYITFDLVAISFRIRNFFPDRKTIKRRFGKVTSYGAFREAFPLLENRRYHLPREKERELVRLINSGRRGADIKPVIYSIKQDIIPRKKSRSRDQDELVSFARLFDERLAELEKLLETGSRREIACFGELFGPEALLFFNRLCLSFADESFAPPRETAPPGDIDSRWSELAERMNEIASRGRAARNRARRAVNPMHFITMGNDMDILRDGNKIQEHIRKRGAGEKD